MKNEFKADQNAAKLADGGGAGEQNRRGPNRRGGRRWNNATGAGGSPGQATAKYPTRNKELPENLVFDNTGHNDISNVPSRAWPISYTLPTVLRCPRPS